MLIEIRLFLLRRFHCANQTNKVKAVLKVSSSLNRCQSISTEARPVITVPVRMQQKIVALRKKIQKEEEERLLSFARSGKRSKPIITCKRSKFNHYKGQTYGKFEVVPLASQGWAHRKSVGDFFTLKSYDSNPSKLNEEENSFQDFGLREELLERLEDMKITAPTSIQAMAIPKLLAGVNTICAAETGSGKTLAYLLPLVHRLLIHKENTFRDGIFCSPLAFILVPGRELAAQIHSQAVQLTNNLPINISLFLGGLGTQRLMRNVPVTEVDIVVSTLGVFKKLISSGLYDICDVKSVVIDEVDTMLDDSFSVDVISILRKIQFRDAISPAKDPNASAQLCLIGATFPRSLDKILSEIITMQSLVKVKTTHLHKIMPHVSQKFLRLRKMDKPAKLLELISTDVKNNHPVVIFSKDAPTSVYISKHLEENDVKCMNFHGDMNAKLRYGRYEMFRNGLVNVLSCTDLASRGLDMTNVRHIINYDFPLFASDYIHRVGRTGRVGSADNSHVTSFVSSIREVVLLQKIEMAVRKSEVLPNVNANIARQLKHEIEEVYV